MKLKTRFIIFILIFSLGIFSESLFQFSPLDIFLELPNSSKLCIAKPKSFINNKEYIKKIVKLLNPISLNQNSF